MLKKNILATNLVFLNIFHTKSIIDKYIRELDKIFLKIKNIQSKKNKKYFLLGKKFDFIYKDDRLKILFLYITSKKYGTGHFKRVTNYQNTLYKYNFITNKMNLQKSRFN